jgi:hypothetical protein
MYENVSTILITEALAIRDGVKLAADSGLSRIDVETDANEVVKLWRERNEGRSEIAPIPREIDELGSNLKYFQLNFIWWDANEAAHLCAKQATSNRRRCLWINYVPRFLVDCLQKYCKPHD